MNDTSVHPSKPYATVEAPELPRIIVWQVTPGPDGAGSEPSPGHPTRHSEPLNTSECLLVIDSIARTSKPIVVLTGDRILERHPRLPEIIEYGRALGLKMIVEVSSDELTDEVVARYSYFGERVFRVKLDESVSDDATGRIEAAPFFAGLDARLDRLGKAGYETHLVYTANGPDLRTLAMVHDYAVRRSARGLYCHLRFDVEQARSQGEGREVDDFIKRFATMKEYSPASMIISPQCVRFIHNPRRNGERAEAGGNGREWGYACLAGKSYAYIDHTGRVQRCASHPGKRTMLRETGYDFRKIWTHSPAFTGSRNVCRNCLHGFHELQPPATADVRPYGSPTG